MKRLLLIQLVFFLSCDDKQEKDCAGVCDGNSSDTDNDGICDYVYECM